MKIYLLNPPFIKGFSRGVRGVGEATRGGTLYIPVCLSYATGVLEISHEVRLIDAQALDWSIENVLEDLSSFKPDLLVVDTNFSSLNNDLKITQALKEASGAVSVVVGPPASQYPEKILNYGVDIVARYEYDFTLKEIADNIENGTSLHNVKGISYTLSGKIISNPDRQLTSSEDLDKIPFVSKVYKNHLNINDYFLSSSFYPMVQIFTGRGCPNKCSFCSWPRTLMGTKYRSRSVENVLDEFEYIEKEFQIVKEIVIEDDTFTVNQKRVIEFCKRYVQRNLNIVWSCNVRATLNYETMREMKKANCRLLICGYESGSDLILKNINKGVTVAQIKNFASNARKAGLLVHGDFIIGLPGETRETIEMTKQIIDYLKADVLQVLIPQPIPGTDFYNWCKYNGYLLIEDPNDYLNEYGYQKSIVTYPYLSNEDMQSEANLILKKYYLSLNYVPIALRQVLRRGGVFEAKRLFSSAKMFIRYSRGSKR